MSLPERRFTPLVDFEDAGTYRVGGGYTATTELHHKMLDRWIAEGKVKVIEMPTAIYRGEGVVR